MPILQGFVRNLRIFEFGAKGPLDPKFGPEDQITLKMISEVQVSPKTPILRGFVRTLEIFEFGVKQPLEPKFGPGVQITFANYC